MNALAYVYADEYIYFEYIYSKPKMEDFYFYTIVIALIILIIMLTMIGIILSYGNETKVFPPVQNEGPDYWSRAVSVDISGNYLPTGTDPTNFFKVPITQTNPGNSDFQDGTKVKDWVDASYSANPITHANIDGITGVKTGTPPNYYIQLVGNDAQWGNLYPGLTVRCAKQKWALDRGIVWDGVTNYNGCTANPDETKKK
jgi:hypothetical protein